MQMGLILTEIVDRFKVRKEQSKRANSAKKRIFMEDISTKIDVNIKEFRDQADFNSSSLIDNHAFQLRNKLVNIKPDDDDDSSVDYGMWSDRLIKKNDRPQEWRSIH